MKDKVIKLFQKHYGKFISLTGLSLLLNFIQLYVVNQPHLIVDDLRIKAQKDQNLQAVNMDFGAQITNNGNTTAKNLRWQVAITSGSSSGETVYASETLDIARYLDPYDEINITHHMLAKIHNFGGYTDMIRSGHRGINILVKLTHKGSLWKTRYQNICFSPIDLHRYERVPCNENLKQK